jgi:hypothetical protein
MPPQACGRVRHGRTFEAVEANAAITGHRNSRQ